MKSCAIVREAREVRIQKREMKKIREKSATSSPESLSLVGKSELAGESGKQVLPAATVGQQMGAGEEPMKSYHLWWQLLLQVFRQMSCDEHGTSADQQCYH